MLDGENPAAALLGYVSDSGTKNLVLGSSSIRWIRRCGIFVSLIRQEICFKLSFIVS